MSSVNKVVLIGNLGKDPEIRYLPSGDPVASFSVATSEKWTDKSGQKKEETQWHRIEVFGKTAEIVRDYCSKGKQVYIEGSIRYDEWTDKEGRQRNTHLHHSRLQTMTSHSERAIVLAIEAAREWIAFDPKRHRYSVRGVH